ncbi:MAG TPA: hypothetical protein VJX67_03900 [Blastocatellia bacterium]|nr:hypothetical protein [Blastocatellia bacterium]
MKSRLSIAKTDIRDALEKASRRVWTDPQLSALMAENAGFWRLTKRQSVTGFIEFLEHSRLIRPAVLKFPNRELTRYLWGDPSVFEVALSIYPGVYLVHYSAVYLHGLTEQVPKTIYVNKEQAYPSKGTELEQSGIDLAFRNPAKRISAEVAEFRGYKICVVHGAKTGALGVTSVHASPEQETLLVTGIERTLIDIAVRPACAGGPFEVLNAYRVAQPSVSVNKLAALLKQIGHAYPYHQAIGFYLERSGSYTDTQISLLRKFPINFNFYLDHGMKDPAYSEKWRLFYPKGM